MTEEKKPTKIEFAPGCFDHFEGTQEELDKLQADIIAMFESGEITENSQVLDMDELMEDDPEFAAMLMERLIDATSEDPSRKLH